MQVPPVYITYRQAHLPVGLGNNYPIKSQTVVFPSNQAETQSLARCSEADQLPMLKAKLETFHSAVHECTPRASSAEALQLPTGVRAGFLHRCTWRCQLVATAWLVFVDLLSSPVKAGQAPCSSQEDRHTWSRCYRKCCIFHSLSTHL